MIAKRIDRKTENDNYRALALYVVGFTEQNPDEKMLDSWLAGCAAENWNDAMMEIELVQELNVGSAKSKTYHLMLSFHPEDEDKMTPEVMRDIEQSFAKALGYSEHQRCCGVHKNTNNMHMHIAYNMIHPDNFRRHEPFRDFVTLAKVRRELELQYSLVVDNGMALDGEPKRSNTKAQTMEAQTGQESFDSYIQRHQAALLESLTEAESWQGVHRAFAEYGIGIKPGAGRKGGLVLYDLHNEKYQVKASSLSRNTSGPAMEKRFGAFATSTDLQVAERERYSKRPLQQEPNRENLYGKYLAALVMKKQELGRFYQLKNAEWTRRSEIYDKWGKRRKELQNNHKLSSKDRWALIQEVYLKRSEELAADEKLATASAATKQKDQEIRRKYPFSSWVDYLKKEALLGNEAALDILRSKKVTLDQVKPQPEPELPKKSKTARQSHKNTLGNHSLTTKDKKRLVAAGKLMDKMDTDIKISISPSGVLVLTLPSGGTVRDNGKHVYFSSFDASAHDAAREYSKIRWGKLSKQVGDNCFVLTPGHGRVNALGL